MKMRMGIDDDHQTYLDAGRIAEQSGVAAVVEERSGGGPAVDAGRCDGRDPVAGSGGVAIDRRGTAHVFG